MAALIQARFDGHWHMHDVTEHAIDPRTRRVHEGSSQDRRAGTALPFERKAPVCAFAESRDAAGPCQNARAVLARVDGVKNREPRVVDTAIRVLETMAIFGLQRPSADVAIKRDAFGGGQFARSAKAVVEEQSQAQHPAGAE